MLQVVKRSRSIEWTAADAPPHHAVFHCMLAFLVQSFDYFADLPIGIRIRKIQTGKFKDLLIMRRKSPGVQYPVYNIKQDYDHRICFWIPMGLSAMRSVISAPA